jgi:hypothetical protein
MRSRISTGERAKIKEMMNKSLVDEVQNKPTFTNDLVAQAKTNAQTYFQSLVGEDKTVVVRFKD